MKFSNKNDSDLKNAKLKTIAEKNKTKALKKHINLKESFSKNDKNKILNKTNPYFILNITAYVPSDSETSDSEISECDSSYEFTEKDFQLENYPFKIDSKKRGIVKKENIIERSENAQNEKKPFSEKSQKSRVKQPMLDKLYQQAYYPKERETMSVIFGLNRPKSLSRSKNQILLREQSVITKTNLKKSSLCLFWEFPWKWVKAAPYEHRIKNPPTYEMVRDFYKQLKKRDRSKAKEFRQKNENQSRNRMVPYRELREVTKNHESTKKMVELSRKEGFESTYLAFLDSDPEQLYVDGGVGFLKAYEMHYKTCNPKPEIISSGYEYFSEKMPILKIASMLDRGVRIATAKYFPNGVYYPEPNFAVKIPKNKNTIPESFIDKKSNYASPQESPILLKSVRKRNKGNIKQAFLEKGAIKTNAPDRATKNKRGSAHSFKGTLEDGKLVNWNWKDIQKICTSISQSHVSGRDWATNLLNAFNINENKIVNLEEKNLTELKNARLKRQIIISLLSRLYGLYSPYNLVQDYMRDGEKEESLLLKILDDYERYVTEQVLPVNKKRQAKMETYWVIVDKISRKEDLLKKLSLLLGEKNETLQQKKARATNIDFAAKAAGLSLRNNFNEVLDRKHIKLVKKKLKI